MISVANLNERLGLLICYKTINSKQLKMFPDMLNKSTLLPTLTCF